MTGLEKTTLVKVGKRFGKLVVVGLERRHDRTYYRVQCDCGKEKAIRADWLSHTKNCGCNLSYSKPRGEASFNALYGSYKLGAGHRKLQFDIDRELFRQLTQMPCYYCGALPSKTYANGHKYNGDYIFNGLDRVDNALGYIPENVVSCCEQCNKSKRTYTQREFLDWIRRAYKHSWQEAGCPVVAPQKP